MSYYRVAPYPSLVRPLFFTLFTSGLSSFTECKNNVSPVHKEPCVADVWSLHHHVRYVPSFPFFLFTSRNRRSPVLSLARMTLPVAGFQFCILGDPIDESQRIGAHGVWIRELPSLMGRNNHQRIRILIPCYPRSLFLAIHAPPLWLPPAHLPVRPPPLVIYSAGHLLLSVLSFKSLWTPFSVTTVTMTSSLLRSTSYSMREMRTNGIRCDMRSSKLGMLSGPFPRLGDGTVDIWVKGRMPSTDHRETSVPQALRPRRSYVGSAT